MASLWISSSLYGALNILETEFELATDELMCLAQSPILLRPDSPLPKNSIALAKRLKERADANPNAERLVYYEKGKTHKPSSRRILLPTIAVELRENADPQALGESLNTAYRGPLKLKTNIHLYEIKDYSSILEVINRFAADGSVLSAWPQVGRLHSKHLIPNDPYFEKQWHLQSSEAGVIDINASTAWDIATGKGIRIGIIDDGVQLSHPDLLENISPTDHYDFIKGESGQSIDLLVPDTDDGYPSDEDFHGTLVAGLAAAKGANAIGSFFSQQALALLITHPVPDSREHKPFAR